MTPRGRSRQGPGPAPADERAIDYSDANLTLDADEDRWAWRARLRRNRVTHLLWRTTVGVVGVIVTVTGLILVPAPGPGWLIVFFGLLILASEFEVAQRLLDFGRHQLSRWNGWIMGQGLWVRGLVGLGTLLVVWGVVWGYLAVMGVPGFVPEWADVRLAQLPGVD